MTLDFMNEGFFERFFTLNLDMLCVTDLSGKFLKLNNSWKNTLGYVVEELENDFLLRFVHPEDIEITKQTLFHQNEKTQVFDFVNRFKSKNGSYLYLEWRTQTCEDYIYLVARDITGRKVLELEIEKQQKFLSSLIDMIPDLIFFKDKESRYLGCNNAFIESFGIKEKKEVIGKTDFYFLKDPTLVSHAQGQDKKIMQSRKVQKYYNTFSNPSGSITFETLKAPFYNEQGDVIGIIGIARDLRERNRMIDTIEKQENLLKQILNAIPDLLFFKDASNKFIGCNQAYAENFIGLKESEIIGKTERELLKDMPAAERLMQKTHTVLLSEKTSISEEKIRLTDGRLLDIEMVQTPFYNKNHGIEGVIGVSRDISMRKSMELKLRSSEEKFRLLFENMTTGFSLHEVITDSEGNPIDFRFVLVNRQYEQQFKLSGDTLIGKTILEIAPKMDRILIEKLFEISLSGLAQNFEYYSAKTNRYFNVFSYCSQKGMFASIFEDSTDRKEIETALRKSEERFKQLTEIFPETIFESDITGKITYANDHALERFHVSMDEYTKGLYLYDLIVPQDRELVAQKLKDKLSGSENSFLELTAMCRDGTTFPVLGYASVIHEKGKAIGFRGFILDISERKKVEQQMLHKEQLLSAVSASVKELLLNRDYFTAISRCFAIIGTAMNVERMYLFQNSRDENGTESTSQRIEWNSGTYESHIKNPILQNMPVSEMSIFFDQLKKGKPIFGIARQQHEKIREMLESQRVLSIIIFPVFVNGAFWGLIGLDECKYERAWTESEFSILSTFVSSLEKTIERSLTDIELEDARRAAEAANVMKSQFLANMSHEIRTPMNGVSGFLELLEQTSLTKEQTFFIRNAKSAIELLLYIINDILDFSKIEAGKLDIERIGFEPRKIIKESIAMYMPQAKGKNISLICHIDQAVPQKIMGDPTRIRQILNNLISNALKFTQNGEIRITAHCISIKDGKAFLSFEVEDTGIGISKDTLKKLFQPFSQADNSTTRKFGGTGLGLAISKQLAKLMGGTLSAESEIGKGSIFTFVVILDICGETCDSEENRETDSQISKTKTYPSGSDIGSDSDVSLKTEILLVEDNELNRAVFVRMLKKHNYSCDIALNGKEAFDAVQKKDYHIIFMDCQMPVMDGYESTDRIRSFEGKTKHSYIVALTANAMEGDRTKCLEAGMDDYLSKPLKFSEVLRIIEQIKDKN